MMQIKHSFQPAKRSPAGLRAISDWTRLTGSRKKLGRYSRRKFGEEDINREDNIE